MEPVMHEPTVIEHVIPPPHLLLIYPGDLDLVWGTRSRDDIERSLMSAGLFSDGAVIQDGALWCFGPLFRSVNEHIQRRITDPHPLLEAMQHGIVRLGIRGSGSDLLSRYNNTSIAQGYQVVPRSEGIKAIEEMQQRLETAKQEPISASTSSIVTGLADATRTRFFAGSLESQSIDHFADSFIIATIGDTAPLVHQQFIRDSLHHIAGACRRPDTFRRGEVENIVWHQLIRASSGKQLRGPIASDLYAQLATLAAPQAKGHSGLSRLWKALLHGQRAPLTDTTLSGTALLLLRLFSFHYQRFQANAFSAATRLFSPSQPGNDLAHASATGLLRQDHQQEVSGPASEPRPVRLASILRKKPWKEVVRMRGSDEYYNFMEHARLIARQTDKPASHEAIVASRTYVERLQREGFIHNADQALKAAGTLETLGSYWISTLGLITSMHTGLPNALGAALGAGAGLLARDETAGVTTGAFFGALLGGVAEQRLKQLYSREYNRVVANKALEDVPALLDAVAPEIHVTNSGGANSSIPSGSSATSSGR